MPVVARCQAASCRGQGIIGFLKMQQPFCSGSDGPPNPQAVLPDLNANLTAMIDWLLHRDTGHTHDLQTLPAPMRRQSFPEPEQPEKHINLWSLVK